MLVVQDLETPMFETMFTLACAYNESARLILENEDKNISFVFPAAMNFAFSIELFLKFFLILDYPEIRSKEDLVGNRINLIKGHSLSALWDSVGIDYKNEIVSKYQEIHKEFMSDSKFREFLALELYDNPFVKWRYVYEEDEGINVLNLDLIKKVNDSLGYSANFFLIKLQAEAPLKHRGFDDFRVI